MTCDILAIGAHPDDIELGIGGTLALFAAQGLRVALVDLTQGEMGSRGTVEERAREAAEAAQILGATHRECLGLPDSALADTPEQRMRIADCIRRLRPRLLLTHMAPDRHPDHSAANALVHAANFTAGLIKLDLPGAPHRADRILHFYPYTEGPEPPLVVDISNTFETKRAALRAYQSQFHNPHYTGPETAISSQAFWDAIETRAAYWGSRIGVAYGEPLHAPLPIPATLTNLLQ